MNLRHRDRVAFLKVCSGRFQAGAEATVPRTGKNPAPVPAPGAPGPGTELTPARSVAGDVVGLHDRGNLRVGDTVTMTPGSSTPGSPVSPPSTSPRYAWRTTSGESTWTGVSGTGGGRDHPPPLLRLHQRARAHRGGRGASPVRGLVARLKAEYGVSIRLETLPFHAARWVIGPEEDIRRISGVRPKAGGGRRWPPHDPVRNGMGPEPDGGGGEGAAVPRRAAGVGSWGQTEKKVLAVSPSSSNPLDGIFPPKKATGGVPCPMSFGG